MTIDEMSNTLVVVADAAKARFFGLTWPGRKLLELETLTAPEARLHERDLDSDAPGRGRVSGGVARHDVGQAETKQHNAQTFALRVALNIERTCADNNFTKLVIAAAPRFLGDVRRSLSKSSAALVVAQIDKDITQESAEEISRRVAEALVGQGVARSEA